MLAAHATSEYPLLGRHATVACERCHVRLSGQAAIAARVGRAGVQLRPAHAACANCHPDAHAGQLTGGPEGGACESCHGVEGFRPSLIGTRDHTKFHFPLTGRHAAADCRSCHAVGSQPFRFALASTCVSCHADPHGGQFSRQAGDGACDVCHDTEAFVPVRGFDHATTGFRLEGGHARTACAECHVPVRDAQGRRVTRYRGTPRECVACHADGKQGESDGT
jgi:hypothetical protein